MSRTWRRVPKGSQKNRPQRRNKGGAGASTGPSPERRRPDSDYDVEVLQSAAALLEQVTARLEESNPQEPAPGATQALWQTASELCLPDTLLPAVQIAQGALNQVSPAHGRPTPETFRQAAHNLQTIVNAKGDHESPRYGDAMVPDGRQRDTAIPYRRDDRVTGLRSADHRRARREARQGLSDLESAETVRAGKSRRYSDQYGDYAL